MTRRLPKFTNLMALLGTIVGLHFLALIAKLTTTPISFRAIEEKQSED